MSTQKKILKGMIIFILIAFLLSMGLTSIMYLGGKGITSQTTTGEDLTGTDATDTVTASTGTATATGTVEIITPDGKVITTGATK